MGEINNPESRKAHEAEPVLTDLAAKIVAIVGGGFGLELNDTWQQVAVWIVAALVLFGSSAWMRQKVTPVWKAADWLIDAENNGWLSALSGSGESKESSSDEDEEPDEDDSDDPTP